jgi:hypothetical protein
METHKLQRNWDHFPRSQATPNSMKDAQRKAIFELMRDLTEYAKENPLCRVKGLRFDPIGPEGSVGVEMEHIPQK